MNRKNRSSCFDLNSQGSIQESTGLIVFYNFLLLKLNCGFTYEGNLRSALADLCLAGKFFILWVSFDFVRFRMMSLRSFDSYKAILSYKKFKLNLKWARALCLNSPFRTNFHQVSLVMSCRVWQHMPQFILDGPLLNNLKK